MRSSRHLFRRPAAGRVARVLAVLAWGARAAVEPLAVADAPGEAAQPAPRASAIQLPGEANWYLRPAQSTAWLHAQALQYSVFWPAHAPADAQTMLFLIDRDGLWYQSLQERPLTPGLTNAFTVPLTPATPEWQPVGHAAAWHLRSRLEPRAVGVRVFGRTRFSGSCVLLSAALLPEDAPATPPAIMRVRPHAAEVPCCGLFEVAFDLPDRYADPFDPAQIDVGATFTAPDGHTQAVDGFYYQGFYRLHDEVQPAPQPQGRPEWRVRFAPRLPGAYRYALHARDRLGRTEWTNGLFAATAAAAPRFVRVARSDPRYFEFDDGTPCFPVGHNIRSPYDSRMDDKFPWKLRHPEGTVVYERFFKEMETARENLVEVWSCAWSLGLEWSRAVPGYHGAGDYHLGNAWELDRVLDLARQHRLHVNLVLNNHGRVSSWLDAEWPDHPYNRDAGGWLDQPMQFFDDAQALDRQRRLYRYYIARWGWDPSIFAWELFSEVNLVGSESHQRANFDARVVDWHRSIGAFFHEHDPNRHLVTTHISADYTMQNPELCNLPELDACAVDAYHYGPPSQIINVIESTAQFNAPFGKPVLITEFGGSPMAAGTEHLRRELHAALWTSVATPVAGTPLFWWWQLVEERNLYPEFTAIARFLEDADPRDPAMQPAHPRLRSESGDATGVSERLQAVVQASSTRAVGWLCARSAFSQRVPAEGEDDRASRSISRVQLVLDNMKAGAYRVEFFDTASGRPSQRSTVRAAGGELVLSVPTFARDIAFRVRATPPTAAK